MLERIYWNATAHSRIVFDIISSSSVQFLSFDKCLSLCLLYFTEGGVMEGEGDLLEGDEEGGGWDVDAEDLELPPDLVRKTNQ